MREYKLIIFLLKVEGDVELSSGKKSNVGSLKIAKSGAENKC